MTYEFKQVSPGVYVKWNPVQQIRTTVRFEGTGDTKKMHVKHEQPTWVTNAILDNNVALQNNFRRENFYKGTGLHQAASIPLPVFQQIRQQCGYVPGQGYDEKKFKSIINDRDYYKLKTTPDRI